MRVWHDQGGRKTTISGPKQLISTNHYNTVSDPRLPPPDHVRIHEGEKKRKIIHRIATRGLLAMIHLAPAHKNSVVNNT